MNHAIHYYTKAISFDPGHEPAVYNLGYAFHRTGDLEQAIKTYKAGISLNSKSAECHFNLASAYEESGDI